MKAIKIKDKAALKAKLIDVANRMAIVRDWNDLPESTYTGINGNIDDLNDIIETL